jgi:hypothetical protein
MAPPEHGSQRYIPHHPQVPFGTRQAVLEEQISAELSEARRSGEVATKAQAILREHREGVIQLLGSEKYEKFRSYPEEQKRFKAKFFFPPRGPEMSTQEVERYQRERKEKSVAWLHKQGIDAHKLRDLSRKTAAALKEFDPVIHTRARNVPSYCRRLKFLRRSSHTRPIPGPSPADLTAGAGGTTALSRGSALRRRSIWTLLSD